VDYIVVGGICAVLHGAPISTFDLDVVHSRSRENVARPLKALDSLGAYYRVSPDKRLRPMEGHLSSAGQQLVMTRFGPLDVLGLIGAGHEYPDLAKPTVEMRIDERLTIQVLDLETLIQTKQETAGEKDLAVPAILRRILEEGSPA
jgi:hypothetical protein